MDKIRVLFVCVHNSARSQIAEAYLKKFGGDKFEVESAGLEPGTLNPLAVETMKEDGIDISGNQTKSVFEFFKQGKTYNYVVTVCDPEAAERCPLFPGKVHRLHWGFADPASFGGSHDEKLSKTRDVREQVKAKVQDFIKNYVKYAVETAG